jgi:hypothetical protein
MVSTVLWSFRLTPALMFTLRGIPTTLSMLRPKEGIKMSLC